MAKLFDKQMAVVISSIILCFCLWYVMFATRPFNFWIMMSFSTALLSCISFFFGWPLFHKSEISMKNILIGILSALILYLIFVAGNKLMLKISDFFPSLFHDRQENLAAIYGNRGSLSPWLVMILLVFPIGFGEEIYWRGFVQRYFTRKFNAPAAFFVTTLFYVLVHVPIGNQVLIVAAITCGLFWGMLYWATGSIFPVLISHMLWDPMIFVLFPVR